MGSRARTVNENLPFVFVSPFFALFPNQPRADEAIKPDLNLDVMPKLFRFQISEFYVECI